MKVLIDTSIWSVTLRRRKKDLVRQDEVIIKVVSEFSQEVRVAMIGPIRQEILSGISDEKQFSLLKEKLKAFDDTQITTADYELAAEFYNLYRKRGIQRSPIDFVICAVAYNNNYLTFTKDNDFHQYKKHIGISLLEIPKA